MHHPNNTIVGISHGAPEVGLVVDEDPVVDGLLLLHPGIA